MRSLVMGILLALVLNLLVLAGFVAWLGSTDRLSSERIGAAVDLFKLTIQEEKQLDEKAAKQLAKAEQTQADLERLEAVSTGPRTLADRLAAQQMNDQLAMLQLDRLKAEIKSLLARLDSDKRIIEQQKTDLDAAREQFARDVEQQKQLASQEGFKKTIQMLEQLKAKQAKETFTQLINQGNRAQVVEYLAAMQLRKAGKILREFKSDDEIPIVTDLLEQLRQRGINMQTPGGLGKT